jgi:hypothetical protein
VGLLGVDRDAAPAALGAQREERENPTVIEVLDALYVHVQLPLPGLLVPLLDPGAQSVAPRTTLGMLGTRTPVWNS